MNEWIEENEAESRSQYGANRCLESFSMGIKLNEKLNRMDKKFYRKKIEFRERWKKDQKKYHLRFIYEHSKINLHTSESLQLE